MSATLEHQNPGVAMTGDRTKGTTGETVTSDAKKKSLFSQVIGQYPAFSKTGIYRKRPKDTIMF